MYNKTKAKILEWTKQASRSERAQEKARETETHSFPHSGIPQNWKSYIHCRVKREKKNI